MRIAATRLTTDRPLSIAPPAMPPPARVGDMTVAGAGSGGHETFSLSESDVGIVTRPLLGPSLGARQPLLVLQRSRRRDGRGPHCRRQPAQVTPLVEHEG